MELVNILRENVTLSGDSLNNYINEKNSTFFNNDNRDVHDDNDDIIY